MWKVVQLGVHAYSFGSFQLKTRIANIFTSQTKDRASHALMQQKIKNNLNEEPGQGVFGGIVPVVKKYTQVKTALHKGLSFETVCQTCNF